MLVYAHILISTKHFFEMRLHDYEYITFMFRNCILLFLPCFQRFKVNFAEKKRRFVLLFFLVRRLFYIGFAVKFTAESFFFYRFCKKSLLQIGNQANDKEEFQMIVVLRQNTKPEQMENLKAWLHSLGLETHISQGQNHTIVGLVGDTSKIDMDLVGSMDIVECVKRIQEPFKNANRKFHNADLVVDVAGVKIGGGNFQIIAGPCSVESREQVCYIAEQVKKSGAGLLRGGAFKPRTSPYAFQGLKGEGIELLEEAKAQTGLPIVSEIMNTAHLPMFEPVDLIQVGARNMQNFDLLRELGKINKPILLKRGLANTIDEWLMSAEYIMAGGNENVILCERGIRTFETRTRNTLDLSTIPVLKRLTHLPIIIDPSHALGYAHMVKPMAMAATAAGADGLMIEVHNDPSHALCDGAQSLTPEAFDDVAKSVFQIRPFACKYEYE